MFKIVKFNDKQLAAINHYKNPCIVISQPGSGKSTVLLHRIKNLVDVYGEREQDILAISFTRKTADELKSKLAKMGLDEVNVGTFHSICGKMLMQEGSHINSQNLIKEYQIETLFKKIDSSVNTKDVMSFIGYQKNHLRSYKDEFVYKKSEYDEDTLRHYYKSYEDYKERYGLCDFDDYLVECYKMLTKNKSKYQQKFVLIDEHQDSNLVQNLILKEICQSNNIFAVCDYRQSIFGFRGSNPNFCMSFEKDWDNATVIDMNTNYRSAANIVHKANNFIRPYYQGYEHYSDAIAGNAFEGKIKLNTYDDRESEASDIVDEIEQLLKEGEKLENIAILYRLNAHSIYIENELRKRDIPYDISSDGSYFKRREIISIISYLRLIHNPHDDVAFENILKCRTYPFTYYTNKIFDQIRTNSGLQNVSMYEAFVNMKFDKPWQKKNADYFENSINKLRLQMDKDVGIRKLIDNIIKVFKLKDYIMEKYKDSEEADDRLKGIYALKKFVKSDEIEKFISFIDNSMSMKKKPKKKSIKLMSCHSSKGLEWKWVYLIGVEKGNFPHKRSSVDEEARLWYVGVTRAQENMVISQIGENSRFIAEYFGLEYDDTESTDDTIYSDEVWMH